MLRIRSPQNLAAGVIFLVIGLGGIYFSSGLTYGSAHNMGPGYFPTWLGWIIAGLGCLSIVKSLVLEGEPIERLQWRPIFFVCLAALLFAYVIGTIGLFLALILMTLVAVQARSDVRLMEMLALAVIMAAASVIVFVYVLKQGMPAWWGS